MAKVKQSITVVQFEHRDSDPPENPIFGYRVHKTTNTTEPAIGKRLSKKEVDDLISHGVTVNIVVGEG